MRGFRSFARLAAAVFLAAAPAALSAGPLIRLPDRTVSRSGQFVVYCNDARLRSAASGRVEELKAGLLSLLGLRDAWKFPVVVVLAKPATTDPGSPPSSVGLFTNEEGFKIQVDVRLDGDLARARFSQQILRALLLEMMHRGRPEALAQGAYREPPDWLVEGAAAWLGGRDTPGSSDIYKTLLRSGRPLSLGEFLSQNARNLDSTSLQLYRGLSLALVQLLVDLPEGRKRLGAFTLGLAEQKSAPLAELRAAFSELGASPAAAEKWWALSLARLGTTDQFRGLTLAESEAELAALLAIRVETADGAEDLPLEAVATARKRPGVKEGLATRAAELLSLQTRCHPLLRPAVEEYQKVVAALARGSDKDVDRSLALAAAYREEILARSKAIADYLNWYEATQIVTPSRLFDGYLEAAKNTNAPPPKRDDAISRYLDTVERALDLN